MRISATVLVFACAVSAAFGQTRPRNACIFDGYGGDRKLGKVAGAEGKLILVYQTEGDWTCGYVSGKRGGGAEWVLTKTIQFPNVDEKPVPDAWVGKWRDGENRIAISHADSGGGLSLSGEAYWHGGGNNVHTGEFEGTAKLAGNRLHVVSGEGEFACVVDLRLIGEYLVVDDNSNCGGMNVRFWGIWRRAF